MKYVLITVRNITGIRIDSETFPTKELARQAMEDALYERVKMEFDDPERYMGLLRGGVEFSNMVLGIISAHIYQDNGKMYHHWKIIEV